MLGKIQLKNMRIAEILMILTIVLPIMLKDKEIIQVIVGILGWWDQIEIVLQEVLSQWTVIDSSSKVRWLAAITTHKDQEESDDLDYYCIVKLIIQSIFI